MVGVVQKIDVSMRRSWLRHRWPSPAAGDACSID
jgi:hypothetical protein